MATGATDGTAPVRLRTAGPADRQAIAALHAASWRDAYRGIMSDAYLDGPVEVDRRAVWEARFTPPVPPGQIVILAERGDGGGAPDGFCCILAGRDPRWGSLIDNLHVRPGLSHRGLGRRLLARAVDRMPARFGATPLYLTVFEENRRARAAYERWGGRLAGQLSRRSRTAAASRCGATDGTRPRISRPGSGPSPDAVSASSLRAERSNPGPGASRPGGLASPAMTEERSDHPDLA